MSAQGDAMLDLPVAVREAADRSAITDLVLRERQGRDRGWWDQMRSCYHDDAVIDLNWFQGSAEDFVAASRVSYEAGRRATHRLGPTVIKLRGDRAVAETGAALETRNIVDGVETDLTSYMRLLYRVQRRGDAWRLSSLEVIYERDTLTPSDPGACLQLDGAVLATLRPAYRFLAYVQGRVGLPSRPDLPGDDRPVVVENLYATIFAWLNAHPRPLG